MGPSGSIHIAPYGTKLLYTYRSRWDQVVPYTSFQMGPTGCIHIIPDGTKWLYTYLSIWDQVVVYIIIVPDGTKWLYTYLSIWDQVVVYIIIVPDGTKWLYTYLSIWDQVVVYTSFQRGSITQSMFCFYVCSQQGDTRPKNTKKTTKMHFVPKGTIWFYPHGTKRSHTHRPRWD